MIGRLNLWAMLSQQATNCLCRVAAQQRQVTPGAVATPGAQLRGGTSSPIPIPDVQQATDVQVQHPSLLGMVLGTARAVGCCVDMCAVRRLISHNNKASRVRNERLTNRPSHSQPWPASLTQPVTCSTLELAACRLQTGPARVLEVAAARERPGSTVQRCRKEHLPPATPWLKAYRQCVWYSEVCMLSSRDRHTYTLGSAQRCFGC